MGTALGLFFKKIGFKGLGYILLLLAIAGGCWKGYNWIYDRGANHQLTVVDQPKIDTANQERDEAIAKRDSYIASYDKFVVDTDTARRTAAEESKAALAELDAKLKSKDATITTLQRKLTNAIPTYVPHSTDSTCMLPLGFVSLYNVSIGATAPDIFHPVPGSYGFDVGAPSGLTCADLAGVLVDNNAEALRRGDIIQAWQEWYVSHKAIFEKALKGEAISQDDLRHADLAAPFPTPVIK